ncbi:hypothetical protein KY321_00620 [Candidatus Woesearchaeota archaeon]|nr:hypothetical protein [Candidatus Woesearchaeota archaeon]
MKVIDRRRSKKSKPKKTFFKNSGIKEIKSEREPVTFSDNLVKNILFLENNQYGVIEYNNLIPEKYNDSVEFMKHGTKRVIGRLEHLASDYTAQDCIRDCLDNTSSGRYSGGIFSIDEGFEFEIKLLNCLEGLQLLYYLHKDKRSALSVDLYDGNSNNVGLDAIVSLSSRTKGKSPYDSIKFSRVPILDNGRKKEILRTLRVEHNCEYRDYDIRRESKHTEDVDLIRRNFCPHEFAAYYSILSSYLDNDERDKAKVMFDMSLFPFPTQLSVDFHKKVEHQTLIQESSDKNPRLLKEGEKEILMWCLVHRLGYEKTFKPERKILEYNWDKSCLPSYSK